MASFAAVGLERWEQSWVEDSYPWKSKACPCCPEDWAWVDPWVAYRHGAPEVVLDWDRRVVVGDDRDLLGSCQLVGRSADGSFGDGFGHLWAIPNKPEARRRTAEAYPWEEDFQWCRDGKSRFDECGIGTFGVASERVHSFCRV